MTRTATRQLFLSIADLAARWNVSVRTVRRLIDRGDLPAHRIGAQVRLSIEDVRAFEQRHRG